MSNKYSNSVRDRHIVILKRLRDEIFAELPAADRKRIAQKIDSALSPEMLTCDGELPRAEVNRRYRELTAAAKDLVKLDPSMAQYMYEFG